MEEKGYLLLALHTHLPFVRHPDIEHPQEENWLFEAITECYLPLIQMFKKLIADGVDFQIARYGTDPDNPYLYVSGIRFTLELAAAKGERITEVNVLNTDGDYEPIEADKIYKVVVNNFMAAGGDRYDTLKEAGGKYDTGFNDAEIFMEYIRDKTLVNLPEERIRIIR